MSAYSLKFALFWLLLAFCIKVEAVRSVVLSCNNDESREQMEEARGLQGPPGRRGPIGISGGVGERGFKGDKGEMGESGFIPQELTDRIDDRTRQSMAKLENLTSTLEQMQEKLATLEPRIRNCHDIAQEGFTQSDLYDVIINGRTVTVYCDLLTNGGKWLVIQRRQDGSEEFYRNWIEYERGFGNKSGEFWLGLKNIHALTTTRPYELRVDLEDFEGNTAYAVYSVFSVGNSSSNYTLNVGGYSGNAGDPMMNHNNHQFSTKDRDNDATSSDCAVTYHGAWWYYSCHNSNLNGRYYRDGRRSWDGVVWFHWKRSHYSMKRAEMKIRPI